jgi:N-acetyl-gamma-glutamyl-phosphate reductase
MNTTVKSGVSGAGRSAQVSALMSEIGESFKAYAAAGHRHLPEIIQGLSALANKNVGLTFVPHLVPMIRGIHATLYATLINKDAQQLQSLYEQRYADEPFVDFQLRAKNQVVLLLGNTLGKQSNSLVVFLHD